MRCLTQCPTTTTTTTTTTTATATALTTEFTLAIEHNSKVAPYYLGRGRCSYYTGQHSAAFTDFAAALALDPGSGEAQSMLAHFDTEGNAAAAIATAHRCAAAVIELHHVV
jgi:tetratricopeptide (TPR) repeat protein